jgi:hypothetical protein
MPLPTTSTRLASVPQLTSFEFNGGNLTARKISVSTETLTVSAGLLQHETTVHNRNCRPSRRGILRLVGDANGHCARLTRWIATFQERPQPKGRNSLASP